MSSCHRSSLCHAAAIAKCQVILRAIRSCDDTLMVLGRFTLSSMSICQGICMCRQFFNQHACIEFMMPLMNRPNTCSADYVSAKTKISFEPRPLRGRMMANGVLIRARWDWASNRCKSVSISKHRACAKRLGDSCTRLLFSPLVLHRALEVARAVP